MTDEPVVVIGRREVVADNATASVRSTVDGRQVIGPVSIDAAIQAAVNHVGGKVSHRAVTTEVNELAVALVVLAADAGCFE